MKVSSFDIMSRLSRPFFTLYLSIFFSLVKAYEELVL